MSQSNDLNELINTITKALNEIIEEKYNEIKNEEYKRLLKLSQAISYSAVQEDEKIREYEHKGITCSKCGNKIIGIRYLCSVCDYFNLCSYCEYTNDNDDKRCHEIKHNFVKLRTKEDLEKFEGDYRFELDLESNRFKINENNIYEISIKNNGKKEWPRDTQIIPIQEASINCFQISHVGKVEVGINKTVSLQFEELKIIKEKYCRTVFTLYSETLNNQNDKFLFPCELHFYKADSEEEIFDIDFLD